MALRSLQDVNQRVVAVISVVVIGAACAFAFVVGELHVFDTGYAMSGVFTDTGGYRHENTTYRALAMGAEVKEYAWTRTVAVAAFSASTTALVAP